MAHRLGRTDRTCECRLTGHFLQGAWSVCQAVIELLQLCCYFPSIPSAGGPAARYKEDDVLSTHANAADAVHSEAAVVSAVTKTATVDQLLATILKSLKDDKAEDIVQIDLRGKTEIGDFMVICSGRSTRQVASISEKLAQTVKDEFGLVAKMEGKDTGDWVLIDTGDVIVHVFRPEVREFYQLEKMWQPMGAEASAH
jgi:ribosome-associated protein